MSSVTGPMLLALDEPHGELFDGVDLRPAAPVEQVQVIVVGPDGGELDVHLQAHRPEVELANDGPPARPAIRRRLPAATATIAASKAILDIRV